jgi:hypothetical protein
VTDALRRVAVVIAAAGSLLACATLPAPQNGGGPTPAAFKQRFAPRVASCVERGENEELSPQRITALCRCPYDVMADALSGPERRALEEATFGRPDDGGAAAMEAIQRIRPLVRDLCGVTIGGPPG